MWRPQGYINGKWIETASLGTFEVRNPGNGDVIAEMVSCPASIAY